ncbi:cytochrome c3 family protein [Telmatobacter sp. DSM 110680]|uniref:Cytochrome c3 family protein n=1 Tax=Telmatobacter sp. DSM 110680 TaxID=3036704 RepID=A0AAU7DHM5_9BACT
MRIRILLAALLLLPGISLRAQIVGDALGVHDLGPGSKSPIIGARPDACAYCHAPHSGLNSGLWNQKLTTQTYATYTSTTQKNNNTQPVLGAVSNQCLSCHDGTVAVGATVAYGQVTTRGSMYSADVFGGNLQSSHPFSVALPLKDSIDLVASLAANGTTADVTGAVKLIKGNVECTSCHDPHVQAKDLISQNFLVKDSSSGQLCLACHDPSRTMSSQVNPLADWSTSAHALSSSKISPQALLGTYTTVATDACNSCHAPHNASGSARLLRGQNEQDCIACHNGGTNVSPMPLYANVFLEYATPKVGHPFPASTNQHDAAENTLLNNNRHATCVDCHSAHGSQSVGVFPPAPLMRLSQKNAAGISAADGTSVLAPAVNQYENCLRCHGTSSGKQIQPIYGYFPMRAVSAGDPLNLIPQFAVASTSSHPVMHTRSSALAQPSLLGNMLNLDGITPGRAMGTQIFCTDCHNSDDNREFGGTGANGPHGSRFTHILERRYEFSQAAVPGQAITNLFPNPDLSVAGPYALCGKCHDLPNQIIKNSSWNHHSDHINAGVSCSTCHTAHGMGANSATISGDRLVNFDVNVVASNATMPVSYNRASNTCTLVCHSVVHNADGTVTTAGSRLSGPRK